MDPGALGKTVMHCLQCERFLQFWSLCSLRCMPRIAVLTSGRLFCDDQTLVSSSHFPGSASRSRRLAFSFCRSFFFFSFVRWKLQSPRWRWQCIASPSGFHRACGLRECGMARFPFWVACRWGRTAVDVLLSDCQYHKGTALYGQCGVWNTGDSWGCCGLSWAWTLLLVPVWLAGSRGQPCCSVGACASTCCVAWPWGWSSP